MLQNMRASSTVRAERADGSGWSGSEWVLGVGNPVGCGRFSFVQEVLVMGALPIIHTHKRPSFPVIIAKQNLRKPCPDTPWDWHICRLVGVVEKGSM